MPGIVFCWSRDCQPDELILIESLDLKRNEVQSIFKSENVFMASSKRVNSTYVSELISQHDDKMLIYGQINKSDLLRITTNDTKINDMHLVNGYYAVIAYNLRTGTVSILCDKHGLEPIYYYADDKIILISSELATFARYMESPKISLKYAYEYLFFNYQVEHAPIEGTKRLKGSQIVEISHDRQGVKVLLSRTDSPTAVSNNYGNVRKFAAEVNSRLHAVLLEYADAGALSTSVTAGWDSKTILSVFENLGLEYCGYTYGAPESGEIQFTNQFQKRCNVAIQKILLDSKFYSNYIKYLVDSVYLSGGLNRTNRCSLVYVYEALKNKNCVYTGIHYDQLFRGHGNVPASFSYPVADIFKGKIGIDKAIALLSEKYGILAKGDLQLSSVLRDAIDSFCPILDSKTHLGYLINPVGANLFIGEVRLSRHFTNCIVPVWMHGIIDLAYNKKYTTLEYNRIKRISKYKENVHQSIILSNNAKEISRIPIGNIKPSLLSRSILLAFIDSKFRGLLNRVSKRVTSQKATVPAENNAEWYKLYSIPISNYLLNNSQIREIIDRESIRAAIAQSDSNAIHKFLTIAIQSHLISNGWQSEEIVEAFERSGSENSCGEKKTATIPNMDLQN